MTSIPRIAFVGCGYIAHVHYKFLKKIGLTVDAICDSSKIRANNFASQYDIKKISTNLEELFAKYQPDVVHILVPPQWHFPIAMKALQNNAHIFIEKPVCETTEELDQLFKLAKEKGLHISADHTRVFNPLIMQARKKIYEQEFGAIVQMQYEYDDPSIEKIDDHQYPIRYKKGMPAWFNSLRGGVVADLLPHPLSTLLSFDDQLQIVNIGGRARTNSIEEVSVRLESVSVTANISMSVHTKPLRNRLFIFCENGSIFIDIRNLYAIYLPDRGLPNIVSRIVDTFSGSFQTQLHFTKSVFQLLRGKIHTYSGLDIILENFYTSIKKRQIFSEPYLMNIKKVVSFQENIINTILEKADLDIKKKVEIVNIEKKKIKKANILVTGGTGFIGSYLVNELIHHNKCVRVLTRNLQSANNTPKEAGVAICDIRNKKELANAMIGIDTVFHCAAAMSGDWAEYKSSTVEGTENLLKACGDSKIKTLIYLSSVGILNYNKLRNGDVVDEKSPLETQPDKRGFYTKAKLIAEKMVLDFNEANPDVQVVIVRPGLVYGRENNNNLNNAGVMLGRCILVFGLGKRYLGLNYVGKSC